MFMIGRIILALLRTGCMVSLGLIVGLYGQNGILHWPDGNGTIAIVYFTETYQYVVVALVLVLDWIIIGKCAENS